MLSSFQNPLPLSLHPMSDLQWVKWLRGVLTSEVQAVPTSAKLERREPSGLVFWTLFLLCHRIAALQCEALIGNFCVKASTPVTAKAKFKNLVGHCRELHRECSEYSHKITFELTAKSDPISRLTSRIWIADLDVTRE